MKLSIVIICWNDLRVIRDCLRSIEEATHTTDYELIVSDNGSTDGSVEYIREKHPRVRVVENRANFGFAKGNNSGIRASSGEYVLILNPDTIIHDGSLDRFVAFADRHPEAGAFGCRVQNPDGSYQVSARVFPTVLRYWMAAFYLRPLGYLSERLIADKYPGWKGDSERTVDWQSGCCVMFRGNLLKQLGGFDERFFYNFEEVDLCLRVKKSGFSIAFTPDSTITHLGGQSVGRFPVRFELERLRNRYRFFYKHYGAGGCRRCRHATLAWIRARQAGYGLVSMILPSDRLRNRLKLYRVSARWNKMLDPVRFVERGEEPSVEGQPAPQSS